MYKTSVYTFANGNLEELAHQKQQKSQKVILFSSKFCVRGHLADIINRAKFYLDRVRGFDSVGVEFLASPWEREDAVNTWLELPFSL